MTRHHAAIAAASALLILGGIASAPAQAEGPSYQGGNCPPGLTCTHWCPGDPLPPGSQVVSWDWNVCHDWYWNSDGITDAVNNMLYPWSGAPRPAAPPPVFTGTPPPPAPPPPVFCTPRGALIIIPPICDEIGY